MKRYLSICLAVVMLLTTILPVGAYAVDDTAMDDATVDYEAAAAHEPTGDSADAGEQTGRNEQSTEPGAEDRSLGEPLRSGEHCLHRVCFCAGCRERHCGVGAEGAGVL